MPVVDLVLTDLPAQVNLPAVQERGEVDQPPVDVPQHDAGLLERFEQPPDLEEGHPDLPPLLATAVARRGVRERLVRLRVGELVLGIAEPAEERGELR